MVGLQQEDVCIMLPSRRTPREDALNLAAWLVRIADPDTARFLEVLTKVQES
jgi:hypothetical protein